MNTPSHWFAESWNAGFQTRILVRSVLLDKASSYQHIQVLDTECFGRMLVLDGAVQLTEKDEFVYHEMLVHVPMLAHVDPKKVAIIGGGDGGAARRVLGHPVDQLVLVEIDADVVAVCREFMAEVAGSAHSDPRLRLEIQDGQIFLDRAADLFDVILVDSTDPVGPAAPLVQKSFLHRVLTALRPQGLAVFQSGSPLLMTDSFMSLYKALTTTFPVVFPYLAFIPSYPGSIWSFILVSKDLAFATPSTDQLVQRMRARSIDGLKYYTPEVHRASFAIPRYLAEELNSA